MSDTTDDTATATVPSDIISDAYVNGLKDPETTEDSEPEIDELCIGRDGIARSAPTTIEPADVARADTVVPSVKAPRMALRPVPSGTKQVGMKMKPSAPMPDDGAQLAAEILAKHGEREFRPRIVGKTDVDRPIRLDNGDPIHITSRRLDEVLGQRTREGKARIFCQNGRIVHITGKAGQDTAGISTVTPSSLPTLISPHVTFYEIKDTKSGPKTKDLPACTQEFAKRFLSDAMKGKSVIPELTGICTMPTIRPDGSIVEMPGYDEASGLYLILDQEFPPVPKNPSREDAREALERLFFPFSQFPFKDPASKAAYFSFLFTSVVRRAMRAAPAGLIDAPAMGTGKSLLTWIIGYLATGKSVQSMTFPHSQAEQKKTIFAALLAGTAILEHFTLEIVYI